MQNGSPLYNSFNPGPQNPIENILLNTLGNKPEVQKAIVQANQLMQQTGLGPQQLAQNILQSGRFSQDQINRARQFANMITGKKF